MLDCHFVNNRIFDALACGLPVISDCCDELKEIFPDAVLYYETKEDFDKCIYTLETDYASVKKKVAEQWPLINEKYSFETRARELVEIVEKYGKRINKKQIFPGILILFFLSIICVVVYKAQIREKLEQPIEYTMMTEHKDTAEVILSSEWPMFSEVFYVKYRN